jgi:hypothetical protein
MELDMSTIPRAFTTDDRYDRDNASDRRSRYGVYLAHHQDLFLDDGVPTASVEWFAFSAWEIACSPIMAPGYVHTHPRVIGTDPHGDDDGRTAITVRLVAPFAPSVRDTLGTGVNTWQRHGVNEVYAWSEPESNNRLSAFTTLSIRVPLLVDALPTPRYWAGVPDAATAKHAVKTLCTILNGPVSLLLATLDNPRAGR